MNLKGHIATGIIVGTSLFLNQYISNSISNKSILKPFFNLNLSSIFNLNHLSLYNLLKEMNLKIIFINNKSLLFFNMFLFLLFMLGSIFPDLDQLLKKKNEPKGNYVKYHRQITHSILLVSSLLIIISYLFIISKFFLFFFIFFFLLGVLLHIIIDIFFGKGGVPLFLYTKNWQKSIFRISFPIFNNSGYMENIIIFFSFTIFILILNDFSFLNKFKFKEISILIFYLILLFPIIGLKNTKQTFIYFICFSIIFFIFVYNINIDSFIKNI